MKILICGDFSTSNRGIQAVEIKTVFSQSVIDIINKHDTSILNLEAPVVNGVVRGIKKYGPHLRTIPKTISFLKESGFRIVTLANNHFYDYGETGVVDTINELNLCNIKHVGGGLNEQEKKKPLIISDKQSNICILNYCESEFSVDHEMGSNKLNPIQVYYDIKEAKERNLFVIVIVHGGHEGFQLPSPRMKKMYRFFIDCGANIVINHHQHCYSGYEEYKSGMIFYGLGNFFFDSSKSAQPKKWFEGYMVGLDIEEQQLMRFQIYPYFQCKNNRVNTRIMTGNEKDEFFCCIENLNNIIMNDKLLENKFNEFVESMENHYIFRFSPYTYGKLLGLVRRKLLPSFVTEKMKIRILNAISCESHRDACINLFKKHINGSTK